MMNYYYREYVKRFTQEIGKVYAVVFSYPPSSSRGMLINIKTGYDIDKGRAIYKELLNENKIKELITVDKWEI